MRLDIDLSEISDGRRYGPNDMVKADTRGCDGCSACCHHNGQNIVLTPLDMFRIKGQTGESYDALLDRRIELHEEEKLLLPNLKMVGEQEGCGFLSEEGWCSIHGARPDICRLFPLGRLYEEDDFTYIFKPGECVMENLSKVKVKKYIDIEDLDENKAYILTWYGFLKALKWRVRFIHEDEALEAVKAYVLEGFYSQPWDYETSFYEQFEVKIKAAKDRLDLL